MKKNLLIIIIGLVSITAIAQERIITGKVTAFQTKPLNNIKISSKRTGNETFSDINGCFTIKCSVDDILTFNAEAFQQYKTKIKNEKDTISVNLFFINNENNRESAVHKGYIDKNSLDYALANLPNQAKNYNKYLTIYDLLKGEFPYLRFLDSGISIGVPTSFSYGEEALLIVDGTYVNDLSFVQPMYVISVKVVKGTDASIYGVRGTNGAIIIETFKRN